MKTIYISIIILFFTSTCSLGSNFEWAKAIQGSEHKVTRDIKLDSNGNIIIVGYFSNVMDCDTDIPVNNISSNGLSDVFIAKYSHDGTLIWCKAFGGSNEDYAFEFDLDLSNNIYVTGYFTGTVDFDPSSGNNIINSIGGRNTFVCKFDQNGNYIWAKSFNNSVNESISITCDANGNSYITGNFIGTVDFDPSNNVSNATAQGIFLDSYIVKLDAQGNLVWHKTITGQDDENSYGIDLDVNGNIFVTGIFYGTADFDPGVNTYNLVGNSQNSDFFILKLDQNGNFMWAKSYGDALTDVGFKISTDLNGNLYCTGWFYGTVNFDPGQSNFSLTAIQSNKNGFVLKLDSAGNFLWANGILGIASVEPFDITIDLNSNVYITGSFTGTADFDASQNTFNLDSDFGYDLIITKYNTNGAFEFANNVGLLQQISNEGAYGNAIYVDNSANIFVCGGFGGTIDFDPSNNINSITSVLPNVNDIVIIKHTQCINTTFNQSLSFCQGDSVNVGNHTYNVTGLYIDTLMNFLGCDSIIYTNLTVFNTFDSLQTFNLCAGDSIIIDGSYIDSTSIYIQNVLDSNGCNSTITSYVNIGQQINTTVVINNNFLASNQLPLTDILYQWVDCNNNFQLISGEMNQTFTPSTNGNYAVIISNGTCQDTSTCYNFVQVGLYDDDSPLLFYPNPVHDVINISYNMPIKYCQIRICNSLGNIVFEGPLTQHEIVVSSFESGFYTIEFISSEVNTFRSFIKM